MQWTTWADGRTSRRSTAGPPTLADMRWLRHAWVCAARGVNDQGVRGRWGVPMRLTWRDAAATLLVGAATAVYFCNMMSVPLPLITDRGDVAAASLLLGFVACVLDE